jgi:hypothetical protein
MELFTNFNDPFGFKSKTWKSDDVKKKCGFHEPHSCKKEMKKTLSATDV